MVILVALAYIVVWTVAGLLNRRHDTFFSPVTVLGFAIFFYAFTIPLELYFTEQTTFGFMQATLTPEVARTITILALLGYASAVGAYTLVARTGPTVTQVRTSLPAGAGRGSLLVFTCAACVVLVTLYRGNLLAAQDYATNVSQTAASTTYSLLVKCAFLAYGLYLFLRAVDPSKQLRSTVVLSLPLVLWSLLSSDKDPLLVAVLAVGGGHVVRSEHIKGAGRFLMGVALALAGAVLGAVAFTVFRARGDLEQVASYIERYGVFLGVDPLGPTFATARVVEGGGSTLHGRSILEGFVQWVPGALYSDKSEDLALTFARENYPYYRPGTGFGYSPIAEGYVNFGVVGVILLLGLMGAIFGVIRNLALRPSADPGGRAIRLALLQVFVSYVAFVAVRGTFAGLITTLVFFGGIALILLTLRRASVLVGNAATAGVRPSGLSPGSR